MLVVLVDGGVWGVVATGHDKVVSDGGDIFAEHVLYFGGEGGGGFFVEGSLLVGEGSLFELLSRLLRFIELVVSGRGADGALGGGGGERVASAGGGGLEMAVFLVEVGRAWLRGRCAFGRVELRSGGGAVVRGDAGPGGVAFVVVGSGARDGGERLVGGGEDLVAVLLVGREEVLFKHI